MTEQSWTLASSRTTTGLKSARMTAPYQTDAPASMVTSPTMVALGAMNALGVDVRRLAFEGVDRHRRSLKHCDADSFHRPIRRNMSPTTGQTTGPAGAPGAPRELADTVRGTWRRMRRATERPRRPGAPSGRPPRRLRQCRDPPGAPPGRRGLLRREGAGPDDAAEVSVAAGLTTGTLYHHYRTKEALYVASYVWAIDEMYAEFTRAIVGKTTLEDRLVATLAATRRLGRERPALLNIVLRAWVEHGEAGGEPCPTPRPWGSSCARSSTMPPATARSSGPIADGSSTSTAPSGGG